MTTNNVAVYVLKCSRKPTEKKINFISLSFVHFKVCHQVYCACSHVGMYFDRIRSHKLSRVKTRAWQEFLSENLYFTRNCQFKVFSFQKKFILTKLVFLVSV